MKKFISLIAVLGILALVVFGYVRFFYVFGEGVKTGTLNYVVHKGVIFKTYEGKLIQSGLRPGAAGTIQSYEFEFSVEDPAVAELLMLAGGENVELHYKEYFGRLPWRGYTKYIVDHIISIDGKRIEAPAVEAAPEVETPAPAPEPQEPAEEVAESDSSVEQTI